VLAVRSLAWPSSTILPLDVSALDTVEDWEPAMAYDDPAVDLLRAWVER
jgi:hypothetical protein